MYIEKHSWHQPINCNTFATALQHGGVWISIREVSGLGPQGHCLGTTACKVRGFSKTNPWTTARSHPSPFCRWHSIVHQRMWFHVEISGLVIVKFKPSTRIQHRMNRLDKLSVFPPPAWSVLMAQGWLDERHDFPVMFTHHFLGLHVGFILPWSGNLAFKICVNSKSFAKNTNAVGAGGMSPCAHVDMCHIYTGVYRGVCTFRIIPVRKIWVLGPSLPWGLWPRGSPSWPVRRCQVVTSGWPKWLTNLWAIH